MQKKELKKEENEAFTKFKEFAQKIVNVPKKKIGEQEKIYQMKKEKVVS